MSGPHITRANMEPGKTDDCGVRGCTGVTGGICAGVPEADLLWCCTPYASTCWGMNHFYCDDDGTRLCYASQTGWCCNATLESCDTRPLGCTPDVFPNPALAGPLWGPDAGTSGEASPTPHDPDALSAGGIAGISIGVLFLLCAAGLGVYCFWKRSGEAREDQLPLAMDTIPTEIEGTPVYLMPIHELDPAPQPASQLHELETGGVQKPKND